MLSPAEPKIVLAAIEWMWSHRGKTMFWRSGVLTEELNKQDASAPKMTVGEADSLFRSLLEKGLAYNSVGTDGFPAYRLHESKIIEMEAFIAELRKFVAERDAIGAIPSGNNQSAHDHSSSHGDPKASEHLQPGNVSNPKNGKPGITPINWIELAGSAILVPWLWSDIIQVHDLVSLCLLGAALCFAYIPCCHVGFKRFPFLLRWIGIWTVAFILTFLFVIKRVVPVQDSNKMAMWQPPELWVSTNYNTNYFEIPGVARIYVVNWRNTNWDAIGYNGFGNAIRAAIVSNRFCIKADIQTAWETKTGPPIKIRLDRITDIPASYDFNSDSNRFEIVNERKWPIFQADYSVPGIIAIRGVFLDGGTIRTIDYRNQSGWAGTQFDPYSLGLRPIFVHPSKGHEGEAAKE